MEKAVLIEEWESSADQQMGSPNSPSMRVLVVEDQDRIASFIEKGLKEQGFVVDLVHDGDDGYALATTEP